MFSSVRKIDDNQFAFVNAVLDTYSTWHNNSPDYTVNDTGGYMYFVLLHKMNSTLFKYTARGLCTGQRYEFSAYLANVIKPPHNEVDPNVRFEVRIAAYPYSIVAWSETGSINESDRMAWTRYGVSFIATNHSAILQIVSNAQSGAGRDVAIDDIELRTCFPKNSPTCPAGK